jgi:hypothetical protein
VHPTPIASAHAADHAGSRDAILELTVNAVQKLKSLLRHADQAAVRNHHV